MINYYDKNIKFNRQALKEAYEIINDYDEEDLKRIPEKIMKVIEDNMDNEYDFDMDNLENIELLPDTKRILTYLYTEFIAQDEERDLLKQIEKVQYDKYINHKRQGQENIFENENLSKGQEDSENILPVVKAKESLFHKVRSFIQKYFLKQ